MISDESANPDVLMSVESEAVTVTQPITDEAEILSDMNLRLERIEQTVDSLRTGVNTIGGMMNSVVDMFQQITQQIQGGGLSSLIGGLMGGKKNDG